MGPETRSRYFRRRVILIGTFVFAVVLLTPTVLALAGGLTDAQLVRLSNLGQAYGAVSVLLSAIALAGVAASISHQSEQSRLQRLQNWRSMHTQLLEVAMHDPETFWP